MKLSTLRRLLTITSLLLFLGTLIVIGLGIDTTAVFLSANAANVKPPTPSYVRNNTGLLATFPLTLRNPGLFAIDLSLNVSLSSSQGFLFARYFFCKLQPQATGLCAFSLFFQNSTLDQLYRTNSTLTLDVIFSINPTYGLLVGMVSAQAPLTIPKM